LSPVVPPPLDVLAALDVEVDPPIAVDVDPVPDAVLEARLDVELDPEPLLWLELAPVLDPLFPVELELERPTSTSGVFCEAHAAITNDAEIATTYGERTRMETPISPPGASRAGH
jgi:hypothetical protein